MNELKIETEDYSINPSLLIDLIKNYFDTPFTNSYNQELRFKSESLIKENLKGVKYKLYFYVLSLARNAVRNRENMRFLRTKMYGIMRRIIRSAGKNIEGAVIDNFRDVFYLSIDELFSLTSGTSITRDFKKLIEQRKNEYKSYIDNEPKDRFVTSGVVYSSDNNFYETPDLHSISENNEKKALNLKHNQLKGISCSQGFVTGKCVVVTDICDVSSLKLKGEILVAKRTDPGWVTLYPSITGLLIEKGSLVSHSAIVAREMKIPTIVSIPNLTKRVKTGDVLRLDASLGIIEILEEAHE